MKLRVFESQREELWNECWVGETDSRVKPSELKVKQILVAVDFSAASRRALEYAVALAKKLGAEVVLLHVFDRVPRELKILEAAFVDTSFREEAREQLAEWQRQVAQLGAGVRTVFREGAGVDREIVRAAIEYGADLIVIGRHGRPSLEGFLARNVVGRVLSRAPCPVLVGA